MFFPALLHSPHCPETTDSFVFKVIGQGYHAISYVGKLSCAGSAGKTTTASLLFGELGKLTGWAWCLLTRGALLAGKSATVWLTHDISDVQAQQARRPQHGSSEASSRSGAS